MSVAASLLSAFAALLAVCVCAAQLRSQAQTVPARALASLLERAVGDPSDEAVSNMQLLVPMVLVSETSGEGERGEGARGKEAREVGPSGEGPPGKAREAAGSAEDSSSSEEDTPARVISRLQTLLAGARYPQPAPASPPSPPPPRPCPVCKLLQMLQEKQQQERLKARLRGIVKAVIEGSPAEAAPGQAWSTCPGCVLAAALRRSAPSADIPRELSLPGGLKDPVPAK